MKKKKRDNLVTDIVMIISAILLVSFTIVVLRLFYLTGSEPSALVVAFFAAFGFESGCCAFIWKTKRKDREDERRNISETGVDPDQYSGYGSDILSDPLVEDES